MSMALAGVDLFSAIVICGSSAGADYLKVLTLAVTVASLLLLHALVCFCKAWRKTWDSVDLLAAAGFLPTLCLAAVVVTAVAEILKG
jgi:O-antigen ligase